MFSVGTGRSTLTNQPFPRFSAAAVWAPLVFVFERAGTKLLSFRQPEIVYKSMTLILINKHCTFMKTFLYIVLLEVVILKLLKREFFPLFSSLIYTH